VFFANNAKVFALDITTGKLKWHSKSGTYPTVIRSKLLLLSRSSHNPRIFALKIKYGSFEWEVPNHFGGFCFEDGYIYAATTTEIYSIDEITGKCIKILDLPVTHVSGRRLFFVYPNSLVISDGILFFGDGNISGGGEGDRRYFAAFDIKTTEIKWIKRLETFDMPCLVQENKAIIGCESGDVYAFDKFTGNQIWHNSQINETMVLGAVVNGAVYFGTKEGNLYAFNTSTGELNWKLEIGVPINSLAVADKVICCVSSAGYLYLIGEVE